MAADSVIKNRGNTRSDHTFHIPAKLIQWALGLVITLAIVAGVKAGTSGGSLIPGSSNLSAIADASTPEAANQLYLPVVSSNNYTQPSLGDGWPMVAANPERTSWVPEEVSGAVHPLWYRPIEAYIPQNVQVIATDGMLFISTARGLYTLSATDGSIVWRFDTELPLGNSPTVADGVVYVGGYDRKIHALDEHTGRELWAFDGAGAGYSTNPLVVDGKVIAGNRDGYMYAIGAQGTANAGKLAWKFQTGGPINISAAYKNGVVYFAAMDNYAYALNVSTGALVWKSSSQLPGDGYQSYWAVIFQDEVVFSAASSYRDNKDPGTKSVKDSGGNSYNSYDAIQRDDIFYDRSTLGPTITDTGVWAHGKTVIDAGRASEYLENSPVADPHLHKPWRRSVIVLNQSDGKEYTTDVNHNGYPEYAPFLWYGTHSGNAYPPIVGITDNVLYRSNPYRIGRHPAGQGYGLGNWYLAHEPDGRPGGGR